MQAHAQYGKRRFMTLKLAGFLAREYLLPRQILPTVAQTGGAADPQYVLQIAQPSRTFLDVGFEVVGGIVEPRVSLLLFQQLGACEACVLLAIAGDQPRLQQRGLNGQIAPRLLLAFADRTHAMANFKPDVP